MMPEESPSLLLECYGVDRLDQRLPSMEGLSSGEEGEEEEEEEGGSGFHDDGTGLSPETADDPVPYVGQRFPTHDAAYEFYSGFAKRCGFSIRRHRTEGKDGVGKGLTRRYFVCHRAGNSPAKPFAADADARPQRNRRSSRCGCQAYMRIGRSVVAAGDPEWRVTGFSNHHNHQLLGQDQVRFLPAYRVVSGADRDRILTFAKSGISVQQMMRIMELEKRVEPGNLPFTEKDVRNLIQSFRKFDQEENVDLIKMCRKFKEKDPDFKYEFTKDANNRLENIAWSFASSVQSYEMYGDAVVFDTTHRLTALDMLLGIWVGLNNYGMPCFFGCALLREENVQSFVWALKVFLNFMNRKAPQTILTDENMYLNEAIEKVLPGTKHALCIWLISARFPSWFDAVLGELYNDWKNEFYRLYKMESTMEFDLGWNDMANCYGLNGNRHIASLFASRTRWALPYLRGQFSAGLLASGVTSKSINAFIQRFLSAQTRLAHFIEQVAVYVEHNDQSEEQQMMQQNLQSIPCKASAPMEAHAAAVLTSHAFSKLQDELAAASQYASFHLEGNIFLVRHHTKTDGGCSVRWSQREELISCSCQMFESAGILCRHALRVISTLNYFQIPDHYLPVRWRRTQPSPSKSLNGPHCGESPERVRALQSMLSALVTEASKSNERMDIATQEVSGLLSRIRQQPVVVHVSGDGVHKQR
ncbi:protein FAR1-RELATED SEQUENCE 11 [Oryza brachyantha]|nr:protein FAR1-RELATED SEQUENCE 11 [Oryza brachyantha]